MAQDEEETGASSDDAPVNQPDPPVRAHIEHVPRMELPTEGAIIGFRVRNPEQLGRIVVRYRWGHDDQVHDAAARLEDSGYVAHLWDARVEPTTLRYWVVAREPDGSERPVFASEDEPHPAQVRDPERSAYERRALARRQGRRSRAIVQGEYVSLGGRGVLGEDGVRRTHEEHYYRTEVGYSYAFFALVDEIRLNVGRMRSNAATVQGKRGLDYGSASITWRVADHLRLATTVLFGFSHAGFEVGAGADAILGEPEGTSLTLGLDGITTLGVTGRARLGWRTITRVPMGATVEVTTFPVDENAGVRLLYDAGYEIYPGAMIRAEVGYRGWSSTTGGLSAGANVALAF
jgi:hypothetical protein